MPAESGNQLMHDLPNRLTAIATIIYMGFTGWLIRETRKGRISQEAPKIDIYVKRAEIYGSKLDLIIKNNGAGGAYNIQLNSDTDFNLFDRDDKYTLKNTGSFKNGIAFLPPNGERETPFTFMTTNYQEKIKRKITINVSYNDKDKNKTKDTFVIDLSEFEDTFLPQEKPIYKIAKSIEKIQKDIGNLTSGFHKLEVITQTKEEKIKADKKHHEECIEALNKLEEK